jgi:uncharacterized protein
MMAKKIFSAIACNLDTNILQAALPLFADEKVEAIEWSFDTLYQTKNIPDWFEELLTEYSNGGRLIGHGVFFSLFSGKWTENQQRWLTNLEKKSKFFQFQHITEHFGFMTGKNFHDGAPISIPFTPSTLAIGQDRLKRIYEVCHCPVGLENLAFSYSLEEVKKHGEFLNALIEPINGFIILDLHNLFCQIHNFDLDFEEIIALYPLEKVREIHISGGSWEDSMIEPNQKIRRDTHDDTVPEMVFDLLKKTLARCPNLQYVVMEQLGAGLSTEKEKENYRNDFDKMSQIVSLHNQLTIDELLNDFLPKNKISLGKPVENLDFFAQQTQLSDILENCKDYEHAQQLLQKSLLVNSSWEIEKWQPRMLETAISIAQKWKEN